MAGRKEIYKGILICALAGVLFLAAGNPVTDTASAADRIRQEMTGPAGGAADDRGKPDRVKEVKAVSSGEYIRIRWKPCQEADGYIIERQTENGGFQSKAISSRQDACAYTDYDVEPGCVYQYSVRPYRSENGSSLTGSPARTEPIRAGLAVPVITDIRYNRAGTYAVLTWKPVEKADQYLISVKNSRGMYETQTTVKNRCRIPVRKGEKISVRIRAAAVADEKRIYSSCEENGVTLSGNRYEDLRILFEGDSITYGKTWKGRSAVPAPQRVGQLLGCQVVNRAVPGSVAGNPTDRDLPELYQRLLEGKTDYRNYDVICIGIGTNDYRFQIPVGTASDTWKNGTFCGYLNTCLDKIREQNPDAVIVLETPLYRTRVGKSDNQAGFHTPNGLGYTLEDYQDAIIRIAQGRSRICIYNAQEKGIVCEQNADMLLYDGLHPNDEGYAAVGNSLAEFLEKEVLGSYG